ncbi:hypothetical protein LguiA_025680 [Lonicera macranthoides]
MANSCHHHQQPSVINVTRLLTAEHNITTLGCSQPNKGPESMKFYGISYSVESNRVYKPATRLWRTEEEGGNLARSGIGGVNNSNMSEDLLINILSRLKVKSLLCFKCVSKYWYTLIEGPDFIKNHYCNLNNRDMLLVLHYLNLRFILADPDPDYLSNRYICKIYGYDIVSDNELYNFVTNSNRFTPIANINSSDDECNPNTTSNKADSTSSNNSVRTYPKSSDELHAIYSDGINPEQAEVWSKEFALAMFHNDDIRRGQPQPPPYEDIIDITGIFSRIYYWHNISGPVDGLFLLHNCCAGMLINWLYGIPLQLS